ncbi:MAG: hypothetical protein VYA60_04705 [Pseudomonadota bacterium]|nr:hypothetical protein [Pseudomonadota bacterium]
MINKPELDNQQLKMKRRISSLYALLALVACTTLAVVLSMKPVDNITNKRDSVNIKVYYLNGNIDTAGASLDSSDARRIKSFNDNKICVSVFRTGEADEESVKNFVLSWLYVRYPSLNITDESVVHKSSKWAKSHEACDDTYMSNVFQYDRRMAQTDVAMDNVVSNWFRSGFVIFLGSLGFITVLWFISIYRNELNHYNNR